MPTFFIPNFFLLRIEWLWKMNVLRKVGALQTFVSRPELGSVFGLAIIVITFMTLTSISGTFSAMWTNPIGIQAWVELAAFVGILAIGASLLMIAGEFDLSMGANIALAGHSFALLLLFGVPVVPAIFLTFVELAILGYIMGSIVVRTGLAQLYCYIRVLVCK